MSTDAARHFRAAAVPLALAFLAASHACAPARVADTLERLCANPPAAVELPATLVIDSVTQAAPQTLASDRGRRVPMTLVFHPDPPPIAPDCPDREGTVVYEGTLPLPLSQASAGSGNAKWRMEGARIVIEFNPGTFDNNLGLWLPLPDGEGRWWLSTFAGEVASGRVTRP